MKNNPYAAAASSIGYDYQIRLALLKSFKINEESEVHIEALDDIELNTKDGKQLLSLKHKQINDTLTDLSVDFWKSVNIWIDRIKTITTPINFLLCTTAEVSDSSFLKIITDGSKRTIRLEDITQIEKILDTSTNKTIIPIREKFKALEDSKKIELFNRITIIDKSIRINDIPNDIMDNYFRTVNQQYRNNVYETLEGWWFSKVIEKMTGSLKDPLIVRDISAKLQQISEQYFVDNLPITFDELTQDQVDITSYLDNDFLFVQKMKHISIRDTQLQRSIFDFFRAYNQRVEWLKSNLVTSEEISKFEKKLIDEWERFKDDQYFDDEEITQPELLKIGRAIFSWAQNTNIFIRPKVTEQYVTRGSFHILADKEDDLIYWLPKLP
ncbi:ABC-three component system protein [Acinetobacter sp.]|uniref:ABC-three component system protein n=1 Tax=Acinetobacter sp. TaxID=472 RepID=UPI002FCABF55